MAGREFFYPFFQTVFNPYINNVANGGLIYLKTNIAMCFQAVFKALFQAFLRGKGQKKNAVNSI